MIHDPNRLVSLIDTRGQVKWIRQSEVEELRSKGWRIIQNPKEEYYPQYDSEYAGATVGSGEIVENYETSDILEVEDL